jgi:hypothetical protein
MASYPVLVTKTKIRKQRLWVEAQSEEAARKRAAQFLDKIHLNDGYYCYPGTTIEVLSDEQAKAEGFDFGKLWSM